MTTDHALTRRCRDCPPTGGHIVAAVPGQAPAHRAGHRAHELTQQTGTRHHDHYDPETDAFLVVRDPAGDPA